MAGVLKPPDLWPVVEAARPVLQRLSLQSQVESWLNSKRDIEREERNTRGRATRLRLLEFLVWSLFAVCLFIGIAAYNRFFPVLVLYVRMSRICGVYFGLRGWTNWARIQTS